MNSSFRTTCGAYGVALTGGMYAVGGLIVRAGFRVAATGVTLVVITLVIGVVKCKGMLRNLNWPEQSA